MSVDTQHRQAWKKGQRTFRIPPCPEIPFLIIAVSEYIQTQQLQPNNSSCPNRSERDWMEGKVAGLQSVREGYMSKITKGEHEAEAIGRDVHLVENRWLDKTNEGQRADHTRGAILSGGGRETGICTHLCVQAIRSVNEFEEED